MNRNSYLILLIISLLLFGCSTKLKVTVRILDRDFWDESDALVAEQVRQFENQLLSNRERNSYSKIRTSISKAFDTFIQSYVDSGELAAGDKPEVVRNLNVLVERYLSEADSFYEIALRRTAEARQLEDEDERRHMYLRARSRFLSGDSVLTSLADDLLIEFDADASDEVNPQVQSGSFKLQNDPDQSLFSINDSGRSLNTINESISSLYTSLRQTISSFTASGQGISEDPLAPWVVNAEKEYWKGKINKARATTKFGTSDIAVIMESPTRHTVKGVRLDATNVTIATFKALNQSIQFAAATANIPISNSDSSSTNAAFRQLQSAAEQRQEAETLQRVSQISSVAILDAILTKKALWDNPNVDSDSLITAVQTLKKTYSVYRPQLIANPKK